MRTTELRIGNLVYGLNDENHSKKEVDKIAEINLVGWETMNEKTGIQPIMLTTEFLEKTELEKDGILYQKGKFAIKPWSVGGEIEWVIFWGDKAILYEKNYPVHRLQNLYFALSDEELQIK